MSIGVHDLQPSGALTEQEQYTEPGSPLHLTIESDMLMVGLPLKDGRAP